MKLKNKLNFLKLGLSSGLILAFFTPIIAEEIMTQKEAYGVLTSHFVEPTGVWVQNNDDPEATPDAPKMWITKFVETPESNSILSEVYAVSGDEACSALIKFVFSFDEEKNRIQRKAYLKNGKTMEGPIEFSADGSFVSIVKLDTPEGPMTMKDTAIIVDENTRSASAHFLNGETGKWDFSDTKFWRRANEGFQDPC